MLRECRRRGGASLPQTPAATQLRSLCGSCGYQCRKCAAQIPVGADDGGVWERNVWWMLLKRSCLRTIRTYNRTASLQRRHACTASAGCLCTAPTTHGGGCGAAAAPLGAERGTLSGTQSACYGPRLVCLRPQHLLEECHFRRWFGDRTVDCTALTEITYEAARVCTPAALRQSAAGYLAPRLLTHTACGAAPRTPPCPLIALARIASSTCHLARYRTQFYFSAGLLRRGAARALAPHSQRRLMPGAAQCRGNDSTRSAY